MAVLIPTAYDELVEYLAERANPHEVMDFKVSDAAQARADDLLQRNNEGTLSPEEYLELEQMRYFDRLVSLLKARALEDVSK